MDNAQPAQNNQTATQPEAESLKPRADDANAAAAGAAQSAQDAAKANKGKPPRRRSYQPSHKATFIGLAVVIVILAVNAGVLYFLLGNQNKQNTIAQKGQVSISSSVLDQLGVNRKVIGDSGVVLTIQPNTEFKGTVSIAGATSISGQLTLNSKIAGTNASFTQLQAGNTSLNQLSVNGNGTFQNINVAKDLVVAGLTQLQSLTTKSDVSVGGNLSISGALSVSSFSARSLTSTSTLTVGGHIITSGPAPGVSHGGSALGSNGTDAISGNDSAGVVSIAIGVGASGGVLAQVTFQTQYADIPRVVITPVGIGGEFYVDNVSSTGFSIDVMDGLPPRGYRINYIVEQ
jgi:hypothetical protein